jgi:ketosteroid isomerase-like protein
LNSILQDLLDKAAIREVHLRYCRGIDRMDWDLVRSCYHPDATDDHGEYVGGIEGFIEWVKQLLAQYESTTHFTGNQLVEVNGDVAWAEHYARAYHREPAGPDFPATDLVANVRYIDRMEKRNGEWRIAKRVITVDSDRADPVGSLYVGAGVRRSRRDREDPSYTR